MAGLRVIDYVHLTLPRQSTIIISLDLFGIGNITRGEIMKYTGEKAFVGKSGVFKVLQYMPAEAEIKISLKSTLSFEEEEFGEEQGTELLDRANADIIIGIAYDDIDEVWETTSLNIPTLGLAGVNEFLLALFEQQDQLSAVEDVIAVLKELLNQSEVVWGVDYF